MDLLVLLLGFCFSLILMSTGETPLGKAVDFPSMLLSFPNTTSPTSPNLQSCSIIDTGKIENYSSNNTYIGAYRCIDPSIYSTEDDLNRVVDAMILASSIVFNYAKDEIDKNNEQLLDFDDDDMMVYQIPNPEKCREELSSLYASVLLPSCKSDCEMLPLCQTNCVELQTFCGNVLEAWVVKPFLDSSTDIYKEIRNEMGELGIEETEINCLLDIVGRLSDYTCIPSTSAKSEPYFAANTACEAGQVQTQIDLAGDVSGWRGSSLDLYSSSPNQLIDKFTLIGSFLDDGDFSSGSFIICLNPGKYKVEVGGGMGDWDPYYWEV